MLWVRLGGAFLALTLTAAPAWSDPTVVGEPASPSPAAAPLELDPSAAEPADWGSISSVFDALVRHYIELIEFTQRIETEREQRAFEEAAARYERFDEFTRVLVEQRERELEQQFEAEVALYVDKLAFTRDLETERERAGRASSTQSK
jgi:hypothetical protein